MFCPYKKSFQYVTPKRKATIKTIKGRYGERIERHGETIKVFDSKSNKLIGVY